MSLRKLSVDRTAKEDITPIIKDIQRNKNIILEDLLAKLATIYVKYEGKVYTGGDLYRILRVHNRWKLDSAARIEGNTVEFISEGKYIPIAEIPIKQ